MPNDKDESKRDEKEIARRRDAALLRALKMPPKPHSKVAGDSKKKPKAKKKDSKGGD